MPSNIDITRNQGSTNPLIFTLAEPEGISGWTDFELTVFVDPATEFNRTVTFTDTGGGTFDENIRIILGRTSLFNLPPVITGVPATTVEINNPYNFTPVATDDSAELEFRISNKPEWASFDPATGALTGTPDYLITTRNIVISVYDGEHESYLVAFDLEVTPASETLPSIDAISAKVCIFPSYDEDQGLQLYPNNTHIYSLENMQYSMSRQTVTGATVQITIRDEGGTELAGATWPLTLTEASDGRYWVTLPETINYGTAPTTVKATTVATTPSGSRGEWVHDLIVAARS